MTIGIIVAMEKEMQLLLPLLAHRHETTAGNRRIITGTIAGKRVALMQCGIGKVNAALGAAALIDAVSPDAVINTGVAGGTGAAGVLAVVIGARVAYHDVWCGPGTAEGEAAGCPLFFTPGKRLLDAAVAAAPGAVSGLICSGDRFISKASEVSHILSLFPDAAAVDMESAAIAQTCFMRGVDMIAIRVVSDTPGAADNIAQYENFWSDAPRHTFTVVERLLESL